MNSTLKSLMFWMVLVVVGVLVWNFSTRFQTRDNPVSFSDFMTRVESGQVSNVVITGNEITGTFKTNDTFRTHAPSQYEGLANRLIDKGVVVQAKDPTTSPWATLLYSWAPILLLIGFWIFFMRQMQSGGNKALSFGKSKAKLSSSTQKKVTFKDVAGVDEAKDELQEIIEFLREPQKFQKLGGRIPKGVLLMGPPGTGKTLLARAVAGEANVPFFSISGSDFVEMFVGVGASRVRDLFEQGKKNAPCIVFIDEIDAVGRHRGAGLGGGHDEREQTLNQLLVEMDGFESNEGVILVAATNRPDVLDPALLRPGRFDRRIVVNRPDVKGREGILAVHTKKIPLADDVDISVLARASAGFSGADLANLVNEAALNAARYNQKVVLMHDFEFAKDKVLMGAERRSMIISDEEKKVTAIHEAGHAVLTVRLPHADPIHKVTIIPRGMALGVTQQVPVDEKHNYSRDYLNDRIAILLGGRIAEQILLGQITTGRRQRPRARHRDGAQHGLRVGDERRDGAAHVRQEGRADLPRPRDRPAQRLQRRHCPPDRPGGQAHRDRQLRALAGNPAGVPREGRDSGRRAPGSRGARRRSGPSHRGRPGARRREAAVHAGAAAGHFRQSHAQGVPPGLRAVAQQSPSAAITCLAPGSLVEPGPPRPAPVTPRASYRVPLPTGDTLVLGGRTLIMGVLNVTPDSFADGGALVDPSRAADAALALEAAGADIIDIGGESTRPGATPVDAEEEWRRVGPVMERLAGRLRVPLSIDTYKAAVAEAALDRGAVIVNDVSALRYDSDLSGVVAARRAAVVLMHNRGRSREMYRDAGYQSVAADVAAELRRAHRRRRGRGNHARAHHHRPRHRFCEKGGAEPDDAGGFAGAGASGMPAAGGAVA